MQANEPDPVLIQDGQENPGAALHIQLLHRRPIMLHFKPDGVDIPFLKSRASRPSVRLRHIRQAIIDLILHVESLAGTQILTFERASDDVHDFFFLRNSEINSVVHHLANF